MPVDNEEGTDLEVGEDAFDQGQCMDSVGENLYENWEQRAIDDIAAIECINLKKFGRDDMIGLHFPDLEVAFSFYNLYANMNGFAARFGWNWENEGVERSFVCFREGFRKWEPKPETRCGCEAEMRVNLHTESGRWIVTYFRGDHNHELLEDMMNSAAVDQLNMMGFQLVPVLERDMYKQIDKQKRLIGGGASSCLEMLESMAGENPGMFVRYLADQDGSLVHLFWSDNRSQLDYHLFGDVLALDATYGKNKYMSQLLVFSGVNHHNQTIVFSAALVANETKETYKWLLQQFLEAMKGKAPSCVITDGHNSKEKAIESVFPDAHHRLCAWHLLRNATSNLSNSQFTSEFKRCILYDYEESEFEYHWQKLVYELHLEDNPYICDLHARTKIWSNAHIRDHPFVGFRTISRCEMLHSMLSEFVHSRDNLKDFVEQFFRCLSQMRSTEAHSDLQSDVENLVLQSPLHSLERSAANTLTREIFLLFRPMLFRASTLKVISCTVTPSSDIFIVTRAGNCYDDWRVSHYPNVSIYKCSCFGMETLGIPCDHIIAVLAHLDVSEMPNSLLLPRWSKNARSRVSEYMENGPSRWDSMVTCRYWMLNDLCSEMCVIASGDFNDFVDVVDKVQSEILRLKRKRKAQEDRVRDPPMARRTYFSVPGFDVYR